jgi:hypothetical protein
MKSLRGIATAQQHLPEVVSILGLAGTVGLKTPISVTSLIESVLAPVTFHSQITTPTGTALGGTVDVTLKNDGSFSFDVYMHDSGYDPYDFRVRCVVQSPSGVAMVFQSSGHTDGTGSDLLGSPNRDFHHSETGTNALIQTYWLDARSSSMSVNKSYQDAGVLHTVEDIAEDLLGFLVADVTVGAGLALVICVSAEVANAAGASFVGPGGLVGVVVAGGVVWLFGPGALMVAVIAGVAAGAITDALIKHRQLTDAEYSFAGLVFGNTLPPKERIFVTNLSWNDGRKYTWPELDGSVILNLGDAFDDPVHWYGPGYATEGQVFIHEMTHVWQIQTASFIPGILCRKVTQTSSYDYGPAGTAWSDFGLEQQGAIVDHWFGTYAWQWKDMTDLTAKLGGKGAVTDPYFGYIANNIRMGQK